MESKKIICFPINISKIREENEKYIKNKINNIKDNSLTEDIKTIQVLKEEEPEKLFINDLIEKKDNKNKIKEKNLIINFDEIIFENKINENIKNNKNIEEEENDSSTNENKSESTDENDKNSVNENIDDDEKEMKFSCARANFYLKNNLYDIPLSKKEQNICLLQKYKINDKYFTFVYPNDLKTYIITQSGFLIVDKIENNLKKDLEVNDCRYYPLLGLYFCGKNLQIEIGNKIYNKKCTPNEFICKDCMKMNKVKYNINEKYFININGRVSKINKGTYHCFGHFSVNNQLEDCITKFTCEACKLLNSFLVYYNQK